MNSEEKYNGWCNRETWAVYLWLSNDEGLYEEICKIVKKSEDKWETEKNIKEYVEYLEEMAYDRETAGREELITMFHNIGSMWRVDWAELARAFRD